MGETRTTGTSTSRRSSQRGVATVIVAAALLSACASSPQLDAQWLDASAGIDSNIMRGSKVLVACDAADLVVRQICQDQLGREVGARGATPIFASPAAPLATDRSIDAQLLPAARDAGARAMMIVTVAPAVTDVSPGVSIGIGGFGFGRHSGVGVGVGVPVGGGRVLTGYSANGRVTDAASGRLLWTARASSPPNADIDAQMRSLSKIVVDAADRAGLF